MIFQLGKQKRLDRILGKGRKVLIVPVDDLLICGANNHLLEYRQKIPLLSHPNINAILGYPGVFGQFYKELRDKPWIINLTTSTILNDHSYKRLSLTLENAISVGCDAVAVHVNMTSPNEGEMIQSLARISFECQKYGIPLMAIVYARKPGNNNNDDNYLDMKEKDNEKYTNMIAHACRVAVELGADIIKTNYTGSEESFHRVIIASGDVPVLIAGGERVTEYEALRNVKQAMEAGAIGVCFGRNFFYRDDVVEFSERVRAIIDEYE